MVERYEECKGPILNGAMLFGGSGDGVGDCHCVTIGRGSKLEWIGECRESKMLVLKGSDIL